MSAYAILVVDNDGNEDYVCDGMGNSPTRYTSLRDAREFKDFMLIGMEGDVQSINVVSYPKRSKAR